MMNEMKVGFHGLKGPSTPHYINTVKYESTVQIVKIVTYHGSDLSTSNFSNINSMHACLNEVALKSSPILYSSATFSTEISCKIKLVSIELKLSH